MFRKRVNSNSRVGDRLVIVHTEDGNDFSFVLKQFGAGLCACPCRVTTEESDWVWVDSVGYVHFRVSLVNYTANYKAGRKQKPRISGNQPINGRQADGRKDH